jgi:ankyrin repeat protein
MMKENHLKMIMDALGLNNAEKYLHDINALDESGATLLYQAAKHGAVNLINLLVKLGGDRRCCINKKIDEIRSIGLYSRHFNWSLAIFKKRTKHVVIASEVKQPSTEF